MSDRVRRHVWVEGVVQGVFFRGETARMAERLGLDGWVRNLPDGRVEAVFEGPPAAVEEATDWVRHGPPRAVVEAVEYDEEQPEGHTGFSLRH